MVLLVATVLAAMGGARVLHASPITHGSHDCVQRHSGIRWWDTLDFTGVDAYFRLTRGLDPSLERGLAWEGS